MSYGVVETGFNIKTLANILDEVKADEKVKFGLVDTQAESVFSQLNDTFANQLAEAWEQLEKSYFAASPVNAYGITLDYNTSLNFIQRLPALSTKVVVGINGTFNTIVPQGTQVKSTTTNELFNLLTDTTITNLSLLKIYVRVEDVVDFQDYTITIDATPYNITAGGASTLNSIASQLLSEIELDGTRIIEVENLGGGVLELTAISASFDTTLTSNLIYFTPANFESVNTGEIAAVKDTLTIIETPVSGLDEVGNFEDGVKGRDIETDDELRTRREESLLIIGGGNLEAIVARIQQEVEGVVTVNGFENRTDFTDGDGRPPHSIEIVVVGGADQDIVDKLWLVKGGGIGTFGNTSGNATDSNGDLQAMYFTRPVDIDIWLKATLTLYDEEIFPVDGEDQVKLAMLDFGNSMEIGEDVIGQRFYGSIFVIPGIGNIVMEISKDSPPPYTGGTQIAIDNGEIATFDLSRIEVDIP